MESKQTLNKTIQTLTKTTTRKKNKKVNKSGSAIAIFGKADAGSGNHNGDTYNINTQSIAVPVADVRDQAESYFIKRMGAICYADCSKEYDEAYNKFLLEWLDWAESNFDKELPSNSETYKKFKEMKDLYMKDLSYTGRK